MEERERAWAAAGRAAAEMVEDGMRVGLGTGRAAGAAIRAIGARRAQEGLRITGVATSRASAALARQLGIPLGRLRGPLDLAFDGADCVAPDGLMVKGGGGAMVRERLVGSSARRFVILVDGPKLVRSLDEWGRLPLAAVPFGAARIVQLLEDLAPVARPTRSDDGMVLMDLHPPAGSDWTAVAARARALPGVLDHGLFSSRPADVLVGYPDGSVGHPADAR